MYLSRLVLNARHKRARSEIERPYELHRTICGAWDDHSAARILFRPDRDEPGLVTVIVQSLTEPDWSRLLAPKDYLREVQGPKQVELKGLRQGQHLQFRLRCRPTKRIGTRGHEDFGKRRGLTKKEDIFEWLHRKAKDNGFEVRDASFDRIYWRDSKNGIPNKPLGGVVFNGILAVTDRDKLRDAVRNGIGTQKAFGFGLLSIAPVRV